VLVNFGDDKETADMSFPHLDGHDVTISAPFEPDRSATLPLRLTIPPHRCVVVVYR
jgi:hypothetical protein